MNRTTVVAIVTSITLSATSCGNIIKVHTAKENVTKEIAITEPFMSIEGFNTTDILYEEGPTRIELSAPADRIDKIRVTVKDGVLKIEEPEENKGFNGFRGSQSSKLTVYAQGVNSFGTYGTGDITLGKVSADSIFLNTCGTGDIDCKDLTCQMLKAYTGGTGDIEIINLKGIFAVTNSDGTGDIEIKHIDADRIEANTNGTGDIELSGQCNSFSYSENGVGSIKSKGLKILKK